MLGRIEARICRGQQLCAITVRFGLGEADADGDFEVGAQLLPGIVGDGRAQALANRSRGIGGSIEQRKDEFLAAEARREIRGAASSAQDAAHRAQDFVADRVRVAIVDGLEVVDVGERDAERAPLAARLQQQALEVDVERATIGEPGEGILLRFDDQLDVGGRELVALGPIRIGLVGSLTSMISRPAMPAARYASVPRTRTPLALPGLGV